MSTNDIKIESRKIGGQNFYVHIINNEEFLRLEDIRHLLEASSQPQVRDIQDEISDITSDAFAYRTEEAILNGKRVQTYVVNNMPYLDMTQLAEVWGGTTSGVTQKLNRAEEELKQKLEKRRKEEQETNGSSDIDPEQDSKLRKQFNFHLRKRFVSVPDIEKYFFGKA